MTRKAVNHQYIPDDSVRKTTFRKRKKGLVKKASELSTLCGIETCAVVYSPYDAQPEVWPSRDGAQRIMSRFMAQPEIEQKRKMVDQEGFLKQRLAKVNEKVSKLCKENREKEITEVMSQGLAGKISITGFTMLDVNDLGWVIHEKLIKVKGRIHALTKEPQGPSSSIMAPLDGAGNLAIQHPQWLTDMMNSLEDVGLGNGSAGDGMMLPPFGDNGNPGSSNQNLP